MPRKLLCAAIAALIVAPALFAATPANLTIYSAQGDALFSGTTQGALSSGHALVHETRRLVVAAGGQTLHIDNLPATIDPEAITLSFGSGPGVDLLGQRVQLANTDTRGALDGALGQQVEVHAGGNVINGELLGASNNGVLLRDADGRVQLVHDYTLLNLPASSVTTGSSVLLDVAAKAAGTRTAQLTYTTSGLGWRAAYAATLADGAACTMRFKAEASIANRSGRDYDDARIKLIAGQPNLGGGGVRLYGGVAPMAAAARTMPEQDALGDYRSFALPGAVSLPTRSVTLAPLYPERTLGCAREYVVDDGGAGYPPRPNTNDYGAQDYRDRAITSTLSFTAPEALPAGTLRAWTHDRDDAPALLGEGGISDTPKGQHVAVQLGQSFDLRASRERTAFHVDAAAHTLTESYKVTLTNGGDAARTVSVREHPSRWREWRITASSSKPAQQNPQSLEFSVPVPAHGAATLTYTVEYAWTAQDM